MYITPNGALDGLPFIPRFPPESIRLWGMHVLDRRVELAILRRGMPWLGCWPGLLIIGSTRNMKVDGA